MEWNATEPTEAVGGTVFGEPQPKDANRCDSTLRIMTFNIWKGGSRVADGLEKIAKHISRIDPDIVALQVRVSRKPSNILRYLMHTFQEVETEDVMPALQSFLNPESAFQYPVPSYTVNMDRSIAILTKHEILEEARPIGARAVTAKIRITFKDGSVEDVNFWTTHLNWESYGPYAACNRLVTRPEQIDAGENNINGRHPGRVENINEIVNLEQFRSDLIADDLLILAGDFNSPSHLDWTQSTKKDHCGWVYSWPTTKIVQDFGFKDIFRELHPDPVRDPGFTWSPIYKFFDDGGDNWGRSIPEPQDRVDYIHYKKNRSLWTAASAFVYSGNETLNYIPDELFNDWPSDHASVVAEFRYKCP